MQNIQNVDACPSAIVQVSVINCFYAECGDWHQYQAIIETCSDSPSVLRTMMISTSPSHRDDIISLWPGCLEQQFQSMIDFEVYFSTNVARRSTRTYPYEHKWFIQELIYWPLLCIETGNDKHKYLIIDCELTNQQHSIMLKLVPVYDNML